MPITTRNGLLEEWYNKMYLLRCAFSGETPLSPIPLPDVTTVNGLLEGIANEADGSLIALAKGAGIYHDYDDAYALQLPAKLYRWYGVKKIGGKTLVWNQLVQNGNFADGTTGWSYAGTNSSAVLTAADGKLSITAGSATNRSWGCKTDATIINGHKYLVKGYVRRDYTGSDDDGKSFRIYLGSQALTFIPTPAAGQIKSIDQIATATADATSLSMSYSTISSSAGMEFFTVWDIMLFDLTLIFGAGNEPSTVEEFNTMFPADYYEYNAGTLLSAGVTEVVSTDSTDTEIDTLAIPNEVQSLSCYGLSCPNNINYIDFEEKKFVQSVGFVDLSTLAFGYGPSVGWSATLPNVKNPADDDTAFNGLSATLNVTDRNTQATAFSGGTDAGMVSVAGGKVYVGTGSISIVPSGKLIYELDEPVETDISEYLTDVDLKAEAGGMLTFKNQNGDDYGIPVPSEVDYVGV